MAVSRKAMTEGIRTSTFGGTLNKARFYNPSVSRLRETREPAPFAQGSRGCSRTSAFFDGSRTLVGDCDRRESLERATPVCYIKV